MAARQFPRRARLEQQSKLETTAFKTSRFDHDNPKTILNFALRSYILFNIDSGLGGGG